MRGHAGRLFRRLRRHAPLLLVIVPIVVLLTACSSTQQTTAGGVPRVTVSIDGGSGSNGSSSAAVGLIVVLTVIALAPAFLIMVTAFTRIVVVLSLLRNALGIPSLPPNQVLLGLALFLTVFVMAPQLKTINSTALQPYLDGKLSQSQALDIGQKPVRAFMLRQTREQDLALFVKMASTEKPRTIDDVPTYVIIPAFILSELKTAFEMGFIIFVPFLIIDIVVSSALLSMGMMMLPPMVVSLPFKILLFVLVDGWYLVIGSLVKSFGT